MGLCPQHNVLFEQLTALEHLRLFGRFKGVLAADLERDIPAVLEAVKLADVQNKAAGNYSGAPFARGACSRRGARWRLGRRAACSARRCALPRRRGCGWLLAPRAPFTASLPSPPPRPPRMPQTLCAAQVG